MCVIWHTNQHVPNKELVIVLTFHVLENCVLAECQIRNAYRSRCKELENTETLSFALPHADVPNALKLPLCILSLNTTGYGCKNQLLSPGFMKLLLYYMCQINHTFFNPNNIKIPCSKHIIFQWVKKQVRWIWQLE